MVVDAWGWTARVLLRKGKTTEQVIGKIPVAGVQSRPAAGQHAGIPRRQAGRPVHHAGHREGPARRACTVAGGNEHVHCSPGRTRPVRRWPAGTRPAPAPHALIGGTTGAGKSGIVNVILAHLVACRDVVIWGVDMKGGMELRPWASCFGRLAFTPEQATELFRDAVTELNRRAAQMAGNRPTHLGTDAGYAGAGDRRG